MTCEEWNVLKKKLTIGLNIQGVVIKHEMFGIFVDIGYKCSAFVDRINISDKTSIKVDDYPKIGEKITGKVLGFSETLIGNNVYWREVILDMRQSSLE